MPFRLEPPVLQLCPIDRNAAVRFIAGGKTVALATIYRDRESLEFERELERR